MSEHQTETTPLELFDSLTGFDELAIKARFGTEVTKLRKDPLQFMRALVFIDLRRQPDAKDAAAYHAAQEMPSRAALTYFTPEPTEDEVDHDPDDPETPVGKGDSQPAPPLTPSPIGA